MIFRIFLLVFNGAVDNIPPQHSARGSSVASRLTWGTWGVQGNAVLGRACHSKLRPKIWFRAPAERRRRGWSLPTALGFLFCGRSATEGSGYGFVVETIRGAS